MAGWHAAALALKARTKLYLNDSYKPSAPGAFLGLCGEFLRFDDCPEHTAAPQYNFPRPCFNIEHQESTLMLHQARSRTHGCASGHRLQMVNFAAGTHGNRAGR